MKKAEIEKLDLAGWPLPDDYLAELGRVTALWATLESFLNVCLGKLAGFDDPFDPRPFILVNHMSIPQKLDVLGALCEQLSPQFESLRDYRPVVSSLRAAQRARNTFLHNGLVRDEETGEVHMAEASARGALKTKVAPVSLADIRRASVEIHLAHLALYKLVLRRELNPIWTHRQR